jgi:hypothetical protein
MKRPGRRTLRSLALLVLVPPALWALVVTLVPLDWARFRLVAALEQSTGQPVSLGAVRLGWLGGIHLSDLTIGKDHPGLGHWLKVSNLSIDLSLAQLLAGRLEPSACRADGVWLRVLRYEDGTLELADLLKPAPKPKPSTATANQSAPPPVQLELRNASVYVLDGPTDTTLNFDGIEGQATYEPSRVEVERLAGQLNGGRFELAARFERGGPAPRFEGNIRAEQVALGVGMKALGYLVPILDASDAAMAGRLNLTATVQGQGNDAESIRRSLKGQGTITLEPITLDRCRLVADLARYVPLPPGNRVGSIQSDFAIGDRRVRTRDLTLQVAQVPLHFAGTTDFDGHVDYLVKTDALAGKVRGLANRLGPDARRFLADLPVDVKELMTLRIQGSMDHLIVTADGHPLNPNANPAASAERKEKFRSLGRRLEQLIR